MMKQPKLMLALLAAALLAGCVPEDVAGVYYSQDKQSVMVKKDGEVLWRPVGEKAEFQHLGILTFDEKDGTTYLVTASAHPYMGTQIRFEDYLRALRVEWQTLIKEMPVGDRATEYRKQK